MDTFPPSPAKNSTLATWSLVLGILGVALVMACIGPLFAIPAVICGHIAHKRIKLSGGKLSGEGVAVAGLIIGYVGLAAAVLIIPVMAGIALPNFIEARQAAQKNSCINNLQVIDHAKRQWALAHNKTASDAPTPNDLAPYIRGGFAPLHCPADGFYSINNVGQAPTCSISNHVLEFYQPFVPPAPRRPYSQSQFPPLPRQPNNFFPFNTNTALGRVQMREAMNRTRCLANLRIIESAKHTWALNNHKGTNDIPTLYELLPYLPAHRLPVCPSGGTYNFGTMAESPNCNITGHRLRKNP